MGINNFIIWMIMMVKLINILIKEKNKIIVVSLKIV